MRRLLLLGAALLGACGDPMIPVRETYPFADGVGNVFHWPQDRLSVRFYADTRGAMRALVARGVDVWEQQFLYGEFRGTLVDDSLAADVIVRWGGTVPPDVPPDSGAALPVCTGVTTIVLNATGDALEGPIRVSASEAGAPPADPRQLVACYYRVVTHELGHSLGLFQHSPQTADLMAAQPLTDRPTARDRGTVEVLYHTIPTLGPPPRD
jgi:hypothetical protein